MLEQGDRGKRGLGNSKPTPIFIERIKENKGVQREEQPMGFREQIGNGCVKELDLSFLIQIFITYM